MRMPSFIIKTLIFFAILPLTYQIVPTTLEHAETDTSAEGVPYTTAQQLFRKGYWALQQADYDTAVSFWRRCIAEDAESALLDHAYFYLGRSLLYGGHPEEARTVFETFSQTFPHSVHIDDLAFLLADSYYIQGDYATALQRYRQISAAKAYKHHSGLPKIFVKLGYCYEQQAQFTDAWKTYHQARLQFVTTPTYSQLKSREETLLIGHPEIAEGYSNQTRFKDADALLKYGRARDALELLEPLAEQKLSSAEQSQ